MLRSLVGALLSLVGHRLAFLVPRRDDVWAFGCRGGQRFEGNAKYLFLHVASREDLDVRPVWVSESDETVAQLRRRGYDAYRTDSPRGLFTLLRARYVFVTGTFTDLPLWPTGGATVVQLWHGVPLKRISLDTATVADASLLERLADRYVYRQFDRITVTGAALSDIFCSAFGVGRDRIVVTGYPRNDALFREISGYDVGQDRRLHEEIASLEGPTLAYLPTYRDGDRPPAEAIDFAALDDFLAARGATLLVKFHPFEDPGVDDAELDNVRLLPAEFDVYPALRHVDALVTDYSSVYFDYLLRDRPVVFYAYDREAYLAERGFALDYDAVTPGPVVTDFDDLLAALDRSLADPDADADRRAAVRETVFDHPDGNSAARVVAAVTGEAPPAVVDDRTLPSEQRVGNAPTRTAPAANDTRTDGGSNRGDSRLLPGELRRLGAACTRHVIGYRRGRQTEETQMATEQSPIQQIRRELPRDDVLDSVRALYNDAVRPWLPEKIGVFNTVAARRVKLLDVTDEFPEYEATLIDALRAAVEPGDDVVVVGGGYGVSSVVAARHAGSDGHVTAFEPARDRFDYLTETAALNGVADRVTAHRALVGPGVKVDGDAGVAERIAPADLPDCDVLVLDCEGAEAEVLRNAEVTPRTVVVETHDCFGTPEAETRDALDQLGYEVTDRAADEPERGIYVLTAQPDGE